LIGWFGVRVWEIRAWLWIGHCQEARLTLWRGVIMTFIYRTMVNAVVDKQLKVTHTSQGEAMFGILWQNRWCPCWYAFQRG
jgi:hypothetical protein